jgi:hypothetical protein
MHVLGAVLMGAGLIGVWISDFRSKQNSEIVRFSESIRYISVFYDGVVVPGALMLLFSGGWFTIKYYGGWNFLNEPWLAGMIFLFLFEFIEGNTITRIYFVRLRKMTNKSLLKGEISQELENERSKTLPSFTHYLDLPMFFLIVLLGVVQPNSWDIFIYGSIIAILFALFFTFFIPTKYKGTI